MKFGSNLALKILSNTAEKYRESPSNSWFKSTYENADLTTGALITEFRQSFLPNE